MLRVTDEGPGIPAEVLPRVFEKFVRARRDDTNRTEAGRGDRPRSRNRQGHCRGAWRFDQRRKPGGRTPRHAHHADISAGAIAMSNKIRVLVVDDEAAILRFLKPALEANNYEIISTGTVAESTKRIAAETPDIVVLDLGLPDGDGKDVIRQVREWSSVPIVVLSARDREAEKIEALDLGADDFVNKPFGVGELLARMRTALRHHMQREAQTPVLKTGDLEIDNVRHRVMRGGSEVKIDAEGIRVAVVPRAACRQGRHPPADSDRDLGAGARRRYPISPGLHRPAPPEGRARSRRSAHHHHRAWNWVSDRRDERRIAMPVFRVVFIGSLYPRLLSRIESLGRSLDIRRHARAGYEDNVIPRDDSEQLNGDGHRPVSGNLIPPMLGLLGIGLIALGVWAFGLPDNQSGMRSRNAPPSQTIAAGSIATTTSPRLINPPRARSRLFTRAQKRIRNEQWDLGRCRG